MIFRATSFHLLRFIFLFFNNPPFTFNMFKCVDILIQVKSNVYFIAKIKCYMTPKLIETKKPELKIIKYIYSHFKQKICFRYCNHVFE